jgi:hypothetical protein
MDNARLDRTCLSALGDMIIQQLNAVGRSREEVMAFIQRNQNDSRREILTSSYERLRGIEQLLQENNQLRQQITDLKGQGQVIVLNDECDRLREEVDELTTSGQVTRHNGDLERAGQDMSECMREQIEDLKAQCLAKDKEIEDLQRRISQLPQKMKEERSQAKEPDAILNSDAKQRPITSPSQLDSLILSRRPDSIPALVAVLRTGTADMKAKAAEALGNMTCDNAGEIFVMRNDHMGEAVAQAGAIPALVAILKDGTTGEEKRAAAEALWRIAIGNNQIGEAVAQAGAIPALVDFLKDGTTGEEKKAATVALGRIAYNNDQMGEVVAQSGAIPVLVALLKDGTTGEEKKAAAWALLQLSYHRSIKAKIRRSLPIVEAAARQGVGHVDHLLAVLR